MSYFVKMMQIIIALVILGFAAFGFMIWAMFALMGAAEHG